MDALARLEEPAHDLLARVDAALMAGGAPTDSPIWPLLRRVGALPGDVLDFAVRLDPEPIRAAASELRTHAVDYGRQRADLAERIGAGAWQGAGSLAFAAQWHALADHIGDAADDQEASISGRLLATVTYLETLAGWMTTLRDDLAVVLARALGSAEAVALRAVVPLDVSAAIAATGDPGSAAPDAVRAAAKVGALVLDNVIDALHTGQDLTEESAARLAEIAYQPPATAPTFTFGPTQANL